LVANIDNADNTPRIKNRARELDLRIIMLSVQNYSGKLICTYSRRFAFGALLTLITGSASNGQVLPSISGLKLQLTANAGIDTTIDGADVLGWQDQAFGNQFFSANTLLPTYVANSGGGKPAINFGRSSGFVGDFSSAGFSSLGDATVFVVSRFDGYTHTASSSSYFFSIDNFASPGTPDASEYTLGRDAGPLGSNQLYHWRAQPAPEAAYGTNIVEDGPGGLYGNFNYYTAIFRGTNDGGAVNEMAAWINGSLGGAKTPDLFHNGSAYFGLPSETRVGLWTNGGSGLDGMIREVLVYNRILNAQEITNVEAYLAQRALSPIPPSLLLQVDRSSGNLSIKNVSGASLSLSGYSVTSVSGAVDRTNWTSIAATYDQNDGGEVDGAHLWHELGASTDNTLEEAADSGSATLLVNQQFNLGATWTRYYQEDLVFKFISGTGEEVAAQIQFSGNGGDSFEFGDLNFDGDIDPEDWTALINGYGVSLAGKSTAARYGLGDLNSDGKHSLADIQVFQEKYVAAGGSLADLSSAVPEPATWVAVLVGVAFFLVRARRTGVSLRYVRPALLMGIITIALSSSNVVAIGLFDDVPTLSAAAKSKLVVHFNGGVGVASAGGGVSSWDGLNGTGGTVVTATLGGAGSATNITQVGNAVVFTETVSADNLHLSVPLPHAANGNWTIFLFGHFDSTNQNGLANSGLYAYNLTDLEDNASGFNLQRDDGGGGYRAELYTGGSGFTGATTVSFGRIDQLDDLDTVWRSVHTDDGSDNYTSSIFANGVSLGVSAAGRTLPADPRLLIGAYDDGTRFGGNGFNLLGEIRHLIVFDGAIGHSDTAAIESYLGPDLPTLQVNTSTGELRLKGGELLRNIRGYEVRSAGNSLNGASWQTSNLDSRGIDNIGGAVGQSWDTFAADSNRLTEAFLLGSSAFDLSRTESLGFGYNTSINARDLEFEYLSTDGLTRYAVVQYVDSVTLQGDYNLNGRVDSADYVVWRNSNGTQAAYNVWRANFGASSTGSGSATGLSAVPEPSCAGLIVVVAFLISYRQWSRSS
jgi:hypothetical protein